MTLDDWREPGRYHGFYPPRCPCDWAERLCVYLVESAEHTKIGVAKDVTSRIASLQTGCPFRIQIVSVRTVPAMLAYQIERRAHAAFQDRRAMGEWFRVEPAEVKPVLHRLIAHATSARDKWLRDGYLDWCEAPQPKSRAHLRHLASIQAKALRTAAR